MLKNIGTIASLLILLASCATKYHEKGMGGHGYNDYRMGEDRFTVIYRANKYTLSEEVKKFALMRASELTIQHGFSYFLVLNEKDLTKKKIEVMSSDFSEMIESAEKPGIELVIRCYHESPSEDAIKAKDFISFNMN